MTYDALRKGRASQPGYAYVVTTITSQRTPFFIDLRAARTAIIEMRRLDEERVITSLAWVLMPDHLHWLFQLPANSYVVDATNRTRDRALIGRDLGTVMKLFKGRTARAINRLLRRSGPVWQKAYYDRGVRENEDVRQIARYISANPLRAGLVESIADYPNWDSIWLDVS